MGQQENLTEQNVEDLKKALKEMTKENPDLTYRFEPQQQRHPTNLELFEKLEAIDRKIDLIFEGHVLIDGKFQKIPMP